MSKLKTYFNEDESIFVIEHEHGSIEMCPAEFLEFTNECIYLINLVVSNFFHRSMKKFLEHKSIDTFSKDDGKKIADEVEKWLKQNK